MLTAINKNQHYVPKCYLKKFSSTSSEAAINLFNIDKKKIIKNAAIKHQCSKGYFYGEDLVTERALQPIEGAYSSVVNKIIQPEYILSDEHKLFLKRFWLLQNMRTEAAAKRSMQMNNEMGLAAGISASEYRKELKEAVFESMNVFCKNMDLVDDLKVCLIKNKTCIDFITSDHPAILSNKWHILRNSSSNMSFGYGSAGVIALLPLTPNLLFLGYDGDLYNVKHNRGVVSLNREVEVRAVNEHQFLNCNANVYMRSLNQESELISEYERVFKSRPICRYTITYSELEYVGDGYKRYTVMDQSDASSYRDEALLHCRVNHPHPASWPTQIGWRNKGFVFSNDVRSSYLRKAIVEKTKNGSFKKIRV